MFNIQLFGSNDTVTTARTLTFDYKRTADGTHTPKYTLKNPKTNLTAESLQTAMSNCIDGSTPGFLMDPRENTLIVVSNGYTLGTAYVTEQTIRILDLT